MTTLNDAVRPTRSPSSPATPDTTGTAKVSPAQLDAQLRSGGEVALLDVRELAPYAAGHIVLATSVPWRDFEDRIVELVPRRTAPVVVYDDGSGVARQAAGKLVELGYADVSLLDGGLTAWVKAGYLLVDGVGVISKALGEFVVEQEKTPKISVHDLDELVRSDADFVLVDTRPVEEFSRESIPDGLLAPGAELLYRIHDLVESDSTLIVVNCAGRTRGLIGAQALINAGVPNPVVALDNGTAAWQIAGFDISVGRHEIAPPPTVQGLERAVAAAALVAERFGVTSIDRARFDELTTDSALRTTFVFDVRTPEEHEAGHVRGARSVPGGQLVQSRDDFIGTQRARVVLVDGPDAVRATITASWLIQIGLDEVYVFAHDVEADPGEVGSATSWPVSLPDGVSILNPIDIDQVRRDETVTILDIGSSRAYRNGHVPGALWVDRERLTTAAGELPGSGPLIVTSEDGRAALHAAGDLVHATPQPVVVIAGGTAAWRKSGLPVESETAEWLVDAQDFWIDHKTIDERRVWLESYVEWAEGVVGQLAREGSVQFRTYDHLSAPGHSR
jgi:rhodanese-related sulfurtransferase